MGRTIHLLLFGVILLLSGCGKGKALVPGLTFEESYSLEGAENMDFTFSKDAVIVVRQWGVYELGEDAFGEAVVRICLDDIERELPEDYNFAKYLIREEKRHIVLTYSSEEGNTDSNSMQLYLLEGTDGLRSKELFDGAYQIGEDGDSYQYVFEKDGTVTMQITEQYYADETRMIFADHAGSTEYLYERSGDMLILKNREEKPVLTLIRKSETGD